MQCDVGKTIIGDFIWNFLLLGSRVKVSLMKSIKVVISWSPDTWHGYQWLHTTTKTPTELLPQPAQYQLMLSSDLKHSGRVWL